MSYQGWVKLHRRIKDHWIYQEKRKFSKFEAWLDLIMRANHKDNKVLLGNELIEVKKGQFITSELKLMKAWDWGKSKTRNFLELLESDEMIIKKSDRKKTIITICNYSVYHENEEENRLQADRKQTDSKPRADTDKNVKNEKNDKEEKTVGLFNHYLSKNIIVHHKLTDPMKRAISARLKDYSYEQLVQAIDNYATVYFGNEYWFTHKYGLADLMRDKDVRRFIDDADPLTNHLKDKSKVAPTVGYDPNKDAF